MNTPNGKRRLVVGNWKMNPHDGTSAAKIFAGIKTIAKKIESVDVAVCPPFPFLARFSNSHGEVALGSQTVSHEISGSFTGEVSAAMVASLGATMTIVGHSERRALGETSQLVSQKVARALEQNLTVVLCIGEKERDHNGEYLEFIKNQLKESLAGVQKKHLAQIVIAYEPIWAIGKSFGTAMPGTDVMQTAIYIRKLLTDSFGKEPAKRVRILYGGSVAPINAEDIIAHGAVDGFLVGRQSLEAASFGEIISIVAKY